MKALLLNPPGPRGFTANRDFMGGFGMLHFSGGTVLPPHNLLMLASFIRDMCDACFVDAVAENKDSGQLIDEICRSAPDVVFINTSTPTAPLDCSISRQIKQKIRAQVVLLGPHAYYTAEETMAGSSADAILYNNVPPVARSIIDAICQGQPLSGEGIISSSDSEKSRSRGQVRFPLDDLPFPAWDLSPMERYIYLNDEERPFATIHASAGCAYHCRFCPYPVAAFNKYTEMSARRVFDEMMHLHEQYGVKMVLFRDALFTFSRERTVELCELLKDSDVGLAWRCETSVSKLDEPLLALMAEAGCVCINIGVETISVDVAVEMACDKKRQEIDRVKQTFEQCHAMGIETFAFFVHGLPSDTVSSIRRNIQYAIELDPTNVQFTFATPFPGTHFYRIAREEGLIKKEGWEHYSSLEPVAATRSLGIKELEWLTKYAYLRFFARPSRVLKELRYPARLIRRAATFAKW